MDYILRKLPIVNSLLALSLLVIFGLRSLIGLSCLVAIAVLTIFCIVYRIAVLEHNKSINPKALLLGGITVSITAGILVYLLF